MDRREFLKASLVNAGAAAGLSAVGGRLLGGVSVPHTDSGTDPIKGPYVGTRPPPDNSPTTTAAPAEPPKKDAVLKLCSQDSRVPGKTLKEKVDLLLKWGAAGIEFGVIDLARARQLKTELAGTGLGVAALCFGHFPMIDPDEAKRKAAIESIKRALDCAAELGSTGVIAVPAFNGDPQLPLEEGRKALLDLCPAISDHAKKVASRILFEPLNKGEASFFNRLETAAGFCREADLPGICMMGDFYHMAIEEKDDAAAIIAAGPYLHHIHLASRQRNLPGQDDRSFIAGFRGLRKIGYQDYCSLECGVKGDPLVEIPKSFEFLRKQWQESA
jgi:sugar phosphate isomerase/epimerase